MNALTIAATSLRRYLRDRTALFFIVVLPLLVIVIVGTTVTGVDRFRIAVVDEDHGALSSDLVSALDRSPALEVHRYASASAAATAARRGEVAVAVVIPEGFDRALKQGEDQQVALLGNGTTSGERAASSAVAAVVAERAALVQAAHFTVVHVGGTIDDALTVADRAASSAAPITVELTPVGSGSNLLPGGFSYSAPTMLVLFVFINSLAGGGAILESRRLGIYQRVSAAPVTARSVVLGETLCYLTMAMLQSLLIVGIGAVIFGVRWGDPLAAAALVGTWALVGTGAGVLSGTLFRTPEQAASIGPSLGIAFGMLGGCMWPLEIVPSAMRTAGHLVPHAWAVDAWTALLSRDASLAGIAGDLSVLLGFAAALLVLAMTRLRRVIV